MLSVTMPRGDIYLIRFEVFDYDSDYPTEIDFTEIYMSVKKHLNDHNVVFQKRLSTGEIEKLGTGDYQIRINPEDTESLDFNKTYPFDIELIYNNQVKQTAYGEIRISPEVTCSWNEVT